MKEISTMNQGVQKKPVNSKAITSIALAVAMVAGGLTSLPAEALVLGQVRVLSHLGEPFRAEIPITQLTKDEAAALEVGLASPSDFSSRGLIYTTALSSMRVSYEVRGNNSAVIHVRSSRPMQDPFMDMLMDVRWRSGSVQRSYTILIDPPPSLNTVSDNAIIPRGSEITADGSVAPITSSVITPTASMTSTGSAPVMTSDDGLIRTSVLGPGQTRAPQTRPPASTAQAPTRTGTPSTGTQTRPTQPTQATRPSVSSASGSDFHVRVERGQTLGRIAASMKPANVTTEQMLAALYKANPSAFIDNNINWLRSGANLRIPSEEEIAAISPAEARRIVSTHARRFNQRRGEIQAARVQSTAQGGQTGGRVGPQDTGRGTTEGQNVLEVTTGNANTGDQQTATRGQQGENITRTQQIEDVKNDAAALTAAINGTTTKPGPLVAPGPTQAQIEADRLAAEKIEADRLAAEKIEADRLAAEKIEADRLAAEKIEADRLAAEKIEADRLAAEKIEADRLAVEEARLAALQTNAGTDAPKPSPQPTQSPETNTADANNYQAPQPDWIDLVMANIEYVAAAVAGLVLLIAGLIFMRRRKNADDDEDYGEDDSSFEEDGDSYYNREDQESDSFMLDQSSSIYAASQLDANADVDPVQEADVYLAYGRDEQAAEILRDALASDPERIALHAKLCEVYARQNDIIAFEEQAMRLYSLTKGTGFEWERIARLAQSLSPNKIGMLGSDLSDTRSPLSTQPTIAPTMMVQRTDDLAASMNANAQANFQPQFGNKADDAFDDLDVSLDFNNSVSPDLDDEQDIDPFLDYSSDEPSFELDGDDMDDDEGPGTRLALAEEFFAIGNKEDAKEIVQEVMKQELSESDKKRAAALMNKVL